MFEVYIDDIKAEIIYIGKEDKLLPVIRKIEVTNETTNTIHIQIKGSRLESETLSYYYKKTSEENYTKLKTNTTDVTASYTELTQTTTYDIKVVATNQNGSNELIIQETTDTVGGATGGLREGNIIASSPTWSDGTASITLSTNTGLTIQWQKGGITEENWTAGNNVTGIAHNETVFARITDGTNYGDEVSVTILDDIDPQEATISLSATTANTGEAITATVTHMDHESGVAITSCKWVYNTNSGTEGTNPSSYTGTFSSNGQAINLNASTPGSYYLHVLTVDKAGRATETIKGPINVNTDPVIESTTFSSKGTNSITISSRATDADGDNLTYNLYVSTSQSTGFTSKATATVASGQNVSLTASGLGMYKLYYYYITVTDGNALIYGTTSSVRTYCSGRTMLCEGVYNFCTMCSKRGELKECYVCSRYSSPYNVNCGWCATPLGEEYVVTCPECDGNIKIYSRCDHGFYEEHRYCSHGYYDQH